MEANKLNMDLLRYIEIRIFPLYARNDDAHNLNHIQYVIERSFELCAGLEDINYNMVYTVAAYHDIGYYLDKKNHELLSAELMSEDMNLRDFFEKDEIKTMQEAIEDHRASLEFEPRNIYGKIVSSADRSINIDDLIARMYDYSKKYHPEYTIDEMILRHYEHYKNKYGANGYAKNYIKDEKYEQFIKESEILLNSYDAFYKKNMEVIFNQKYFDLETILSLTSVRKFTTMDEIEKAYLYITDNKNISYNEVIAHIYKSNPLFESLTEQVQNIDLNDVYDIIEYSKEIHGDSFPLTKIPSKQLKI
jgi:uncharacterized protein